MRAISIIFRRELGAYFKSPMGWIIAAAALLIDGLLFYTKALGPSSGARLSGEVLSNFFMWSSGMHMAAAILLSMRLVAHERTTGSIVLLNTSPVRDVELVIGKFLGALVFLCGIMALTAYMPLLILVNGKISFAHVVAGYAGMALLGGVALAIGMFATSLAHEQIIAGAIGGAIAGSLYLLGFAISAVDPPLRGIVEGIAIWHKHFVPFARGIVHVEHVAYYLAMIYFFLLLATKTLEAKRWQ